jgi:spermidine synthase
MYSFCNTMSHMPANYGKVCFEKSEYIVYEPYPGLHLAYHAKRFCFSGRSKYQKIDIIDNEAYGRMLFLDNNVQHTSYDAHIFREALCGTAKRNRVARVLVLGGGSGQTALALIESPSIENVTVVEIDRLVLESCKKYVRGVDRAFKDRRVRTEIGDAFDYLDSTDEKFDAAIIDFTETPFGIRDYAATLKRLYTNVKRKCNGRCSQYIGSAVELAYDRQLRNLVSDVSKRYLSDITYTHTFIPSFGAPHVIMHAGYEKG